MDDDQLLPVRMINEVVFCPRLFWLEEVAGAFVDNAHTVIGQAKHKRVDKPGGNISAPSSSSGEGEPEAPAWEARSLWLSSLTLGVSGKLDLVDSLADGGVMPVDTKKGRGPRTDEHVDGLWPADEVQLVLQALLLREAGYTVTQVAAYYAEERRRVVVVLRDEQIERAHAAIELARTIRLQDAAPPPLVDSPKCRGCSLVDICQPDELAALREGREHSEEEPLRRVTPVREDRAHVVVVSGRARVGIEGSRLVIVEKDEEDLDLTHRVALSTIGSLSIYGRAVVTTPAIHAVLENGADIAFHSGGGYFLGRASSTTSNQVLTRVAQFRESAQSRGFGIARVLIADKIANQRTFLRRNAAERDDGVLARLSRLAEEALTVADPPHLLAIEGEAAKKHWQAFSSIVGRDEPAFVMNGRTRRPPRDATNAMISYLSGMLARDCTHALAHAGLDPFLGVYHTAHHGRPSLALDLMEPFRPLMIDSVILGVVRRGEVDKTGFVNAGLEVRMDSPTKKALAAAYERRARDLVTHPRFGYRVSYRQTLGIQARLLARVMTGELDAMVSFRTR